MGNKISDIIGVIETGLKTIEGLSVVRRAVNPFTEPNFPAAGIVVDGSPREIEAGSWESWPVVVLVGLVMRRGEGDEDQGIMDLVTLVLEKIKAVNDSDAPGGVIDRPRWTTWRHVQEGKPLVLMGAAIEIRVTIEGPLVTEDEEA